MGQAFSETEVDETSTAVENAEGVAVEASTAESAGEAGSETPTEAPTEGEKPAEKEGPSSDELKAAFVEALEASIGHEARDTATGALPEVALAGVKVAYGNLPIRLKAWAREYVTTLTPAAMEAGDWIKARSLVEVLNAFKTAVTPRAAAVKEPVDPTADFVNKVAAHYLAPSLCKPGEGVAANYAELARSTAESLVAQVKDYLTWENENEALPEGERKEAPEGLNPVIAQALRIARGRGVAGAGRPTKAGEKAPRRARVASGTRRDVAAHILNAFKDKPAGTFLSISEIVNTPSEEYGEDKPSAGAVSARLFPGEGKESNVEGVTPAVQDGKKGATN